MNLQDLLGQSEGPLPTEPGSFAQRIKDQYGSEADPNITLEGSSEDSDFTSEIVQRLAGREGAYGRYVLKGEVARGGQLDRLLWYAAALVHGNDAGVVELSRDLGFFEDTSSGWALRSCAAPDPHRRGPGPR